MLNRYGTNALWAWFVKSVNRDHPLVAIRASPNEKITWGKLSAETPKFVTRAMQPLFCQLFLAMFWIFELPRFHKIQIKQGIIISLNAHLNNHDRSL